MTFCSVQFAYLSLIVLPYYFPFVLILIHLFQYVIIERIYSMLLNMIGIFQSTLCMC